MSIDEAETPRIYQSEGAFADRFDRPDIVNDDKVDLSRMAEHELTKSNIDNAGQAENCTKRNIEYTTLKNICSFSPKI